MAGEGVLDLECTYHLIDPRHAREVFVPTLTGSAEARARMVAWVDEVTPHGLAGAASVVQALIDLWQEALGYGIDADDSLASGVVWNYGLLWGFAKPVFQARGLGLSFLEEAGLGGLAHGRVASQGLLFADEEGNALPGVPAWIPLEAHASFVGAEMAGGLIPAHLVPAMREQCEADLAGYAARLARAGRDPVESLEAVYGALVAASEEGFAILELAQAVTAARSLVPPPNVRRAGKPGADPRVREAVARAVRDAGLARSASPAAPAPVVVSVPPLPLPPPVVPPPLAEKPTWSPFPSAQELSGAEAPVAVAARAPTSVSFARSPDRAPVPAVVITVPEVPAEQRPAASGGASAAGLAVTSTEASADASAGASTDVSPPDVAANEAALDVAVEEGAAPSEAPAPAPAPVSQSAAVRLLSALADALEAKEATRKRYASVAAPAASAAPPAAALDTDAPIADAVDLGGAAPAAGDAPEALHLEAPEAAASAPESDVPAAVPAAVLAAATSSEAAETTAPTPSTPSEAPVSPAPAPADGDRRPILSSAAARLLGRPAPLTDPGGTATLSQQRALELAGAHGPVAAATAAAERPLHVPPPATAPRPRPAARAEHDATATVQIDFKPADLGHLVFGRAPLKPGETPTPDVFEVRARVIPLSGSAEARFTAAGERLKAFRGIPRAGHTAESAEGFWERLGSGMVDLASELQCDAQERGIPIERVDLGVTGTARRDPSGLHLEDVTVQVRALAWPWVIAERAEGLRSIVGRAAYLWLGGSPVRGGLRIRKPQLDPLPARLADVDLTRGVPAPPYGQRTAGLVEAGPRVVPALLDHLLGQDPAWRLEALLALAVMGDRRALRPLVSVAALRAEESLPFSIAIGHKRLVSAGAPHDAYTVADVASWALALWTHLDRIGTARPIRRDPPFWRRFVDEHGAEDDEAWRLYAIERAADALCSGDPLERAYAAERLGERDLASAEAGRPLEVVLKATEPEMVVSAAIRSAAACRTRALVPELQLLLDDARLPPRGVLFNGFRPLGVRDHAARAISAILRKPLAPLSGRPDPLDPTREVFSDDELHVQLQQARSWASRV